jgi:hypothetical protein
VLPNCNYKWLPELAGIVLGLTGEREGQSRKGRMKLAALKHLPPLRFWILVAILILALAPSLDAAGPDSNRAAGSEQAPSPELAGGWRFVRTRNPQGGADAISIMHTADTSKSDLDLAGLMIRCTERGTEAVVVVIRAFPLRARPHIVLGKPGNEARFEATIAPPGTLILISMDATSLVSSAWHTQSDLFIRLEDGPITIRGVVALAGLQSAFEVLATSCPTQ